MADNVTIPVTGTGDATPVVAADDIAGVKHQRVKVEWGADGVVNDTSAAAPLPVVQTGTPALPTGAATETTIAAVNTKLGSALPLPTGASTETTLAAVNTKLGSALPLPTGAATAAKQPALGTAGVASTDVLTIQGIASGVAIPVSGTFSASGTTDLTATASITGSAQAATISTLNGMSSLAIDVSGTFSATLLIEATIDGTNWFGISVGPGAGSTFQNDSLTGSNSITVGRNLASVSGFSGVRVRCTAYVSGTAVVVLRATAAPGSVFLGAALPVGGNSIGSISGVGSTVLVDPSGGGARFPANVNQIVGTTVDVNNGVVSAGTQRVTIASDSTGQVKLATGANTIGALTANQSVNLAQTNGGAIAVGHGTAATAMRVELPTDGTGTVVLAAGAAAIGTVVTELTTGLTTFSNTALSSTKTAVKASAGKVYGWMIHNPSAATTFIQVWNVAIGSITVGTTAPTYVIAIPAGASANVFTERGITHSTEINIAATTTATGSSAPATAAVVGIFYI